MRRLPAGPKGGAADPLANLRFEFGMSMSNVTADQARHASVFPLRVVQLLQAHQAVSTLKLSLTQGYWNEAAWGAAPPAPTGAELWAAFPEGSSNRSTGVEGAWRGLVNTMSGHFGPAASSLAFDDSGQPSHLFRHEVPASAAVVYAAKQNEVVCIDHLQPFLSLLPCRTQGYAALLSSHASQLALTASAQYLSISLQASRTVLQDADTGTSTATYEVALAVEAVLTKSSLTRIAPVLTVTPVNAAATPMLSCCLCEAGTPDHHLSVELGGGEVHVHELRPPAARGGGTGVGAQLAGKLATFWDPPVAEEEEEEGRAAAAQSVAAAADVSIDVYLGGRPAGYRQATLVFELYNSHASADVVGSLWHVMPWVVRIRHSTMSVVQGPWRGAGGRRQPRLDESGHGPGDGAAVAAAAALLQAAFTPSTRYRASSMELLLRLPAQTRTVVSFEFDREHARFSQFPPDAARGFDGTTPLFAYWMVGSGSNCSAATAAASAASTAGAGGGAARLSRGVQVGGEPGGADGHRVRQGGADGAAELAGLLHALQHHLRLLHAAGDTLRHNHVRHPGSEPVYTRLGGGRRRRARRGGRGAEAPADCPAHLWLPAPV
eukprot:SAG22_NODE_1481_length_4326_cov_2.970901_1_plen_606_part_00